MPAPTEKARRFFGVVRAVQKGDMSTRAVSADVRDAARDMSVSSVRDFARKPTRADKTRSRSRSKR